MTTETSSPNFNIMPDAKAVFKTILLLDQRFGINYLTQILKGHTRFPLKNALHEKLETFGSLKHLTEQKIKSMIAWLLEQQYIYTTNFDYGTLGLTPKGKERLASDLAWNIHSWTFNRKTEDWVLEDALKSLRKSMAVMENKAPYEIFTDYTIQTIVREKPIHITELKSIPGITDAFSDKYGQVVLRAVKNAGQDAERILHENLLKRVQAPAYQSVKTMFQSGFSLKEMIKSTSKTLNDIVKILTDLHKAEEINLKSFIEQNIDAKSLHKATTFFQETDEPRLKVAYETLGLDYETLRLCKLYVADVKKQVVGI